MNPRYPEGLFMPEDLSYNDLKVKWLCNEANYGSQMIIYGKLINDMALVGENTDLLVEALNDAKIVYITLKELLEKEFHTQSDRLKESTEYEQKYES